MSLFRSLNNSSWNPDVPSSIYGGGVGVGGWEEEEGGGGEEEGGEGGGETGYKEEGANIPPTPSPPYNPTLM